MSTPKMMTLEQTQRWGHLLAASLVTRDVPLTRHLLTSGFEPNAANFRLVLTVIPGIAAGILHRRNPDGDFAIPRLEGEQTDAAKTAGQLAALAFNGDSPMQQDVITALLHRANDDPDTMRGATLLSDTVMTLVVFLSDVLHGKGQVTS